jgi:hypothetical protein
MSVKLLEAFRETNVTTVSAVVTFAVNSLMVTNRPFRKRFSHRNKKKLGGDKCGKYGECSKPAILYLARHFLTTND